jgi:hypothetical protein
MAATDWLPHSVRGLVSSLIRQGGQKIEAIKRESGERAHHLAAGKQPTGPQIPIPGPPTAAWQRGGKGRRHALMPIPSLSSWGRRSLK